MNKLIIFLVFAVLFASCSKDEPEPKLLNQFTIDGEVYEIAGVYNYCGYQYSAGKKLYSTTLMISDVVMSDTPSYLFKDIASGDYNIEGASIILITELVGEVETYNEIWDFTDNMVSTFIASDVSINLNFNDGGYSSITKLNSLINNGVYHDSEYEIKFTGKTTDGRTIECYYLGGQGTSVTEK
ncbi:hypothetical protein [Maribellus maritimus]|jgi:hypothetical protein|uniref:hypothetical protein n=1 Tax=Maribellus maritimus TaxID=2870838 RepID=UPI001EEB7B03|nr:hypothetical protein [Maribellus maritimus]MCG6190073.1 hypothetical protein [Maribellus maritimus]